MARKVGSLPEEPGEKTLMVMDDRKMEKLKMSESSMWKLY